MLRPLIQRPTPSTRSAPPQTSTSASRNAGIVSLITDQLQEVLSQAVVSKVGGKLLLEVRLVDTGDIRGFHGPVFIPETRTQ